MINKSWRKVLARLIGLGVMGSAMALGLTACSTAPVSIERQPAILIEQQEIEIGQRDLAIQVQADGGSYQNDPNLIAFVTDVGNRLTQQSKRPHLPYQFVVLDNSAPIIWALPGGKVGISRGLLTALQSEAELAALLALQIAHIDERHTIQRHPSLLLYALQNTVTASLARRVLQHDLEPAYQQPPIIYSEDQGSVADRSGMRILAGAGYDPRAWAQLQERWLAIIESGDQGPFKTLFTQHPPTVERLQALQEMLHDYLPMGKVNRSGYQRAIKKLEQKQPAYEYAEQALQALANNKFHRALSLSKQALAMAPEESLFYEINAVALIQLNRARDALEALAQSIHRNPDYYRPLLRRGMLRYKLGATAQAKADLQASLLLAPTFAGLEKLGEIAEINGHCQQAINYYALALDMNEAKRQKLENRIAALRLTCD